MFDCTRGITFEPREVCPQTQPKYHSCCGPGLAPATQKLEACACVLPCDLLCRLQSKGSCVTRLHWTHEANCSLTSRMPVCLCRAVSPIPQMAARMVAARPDHCQRCAQGLGSSKSVSQQSELWVHHPDITKWARLVVHTCRRCVLELLVTEYCLVQQTGDPCSRV